MRECLDLGCAPSDEDCAQVGREGYHERARRECRAYINQLRRLFGEEPEGAALAVKSNAHDFGSYLSVVCYFEADDQAAIEYAYRCEGQGPELWDEQAKAELANGSGHKPRKEKSR